MVLEIVGHDPAKRVTRLQRGDVVGPGYPAAALVHGPGDILHLILAQRPPPPGDLGVERGRDVGRYHHPAGLAGSGEVTGQFGFLDSVTEGLA